MPRDGRLADVQPAGQVDAPQPVEGRLVELHQKHELAQRQAVYRAQAGIDPRFDEGLGAKEPQDCREGGN